MVELTLLIVVFLAMMFAPLSIGFLSLNRAKDNRLIIRSENRKDHRYFAQSFNTMLERAISRAPGETVIRLSKDETLLQAESIPPNAKVISSIVLAASDFYTNGIQQFDKEICAQRNAFIGPNCMLRAIAVKGDLVFEANCKVIRWADAQGKIVVKTGTTLGMSCSSLQEISLETGCAFRRLYAPAISVTRADGRAAKDSLPLAKENEHQHAEWLHDVRMIKDYSSIRTTIIAQKSLRIGSYATILGDIRSERKLYIGEGTVIAGNVFCDGYVVLESGVHIKGVVFSQGSIYCGPDCRVGGNGSMKSLVAKENIVLGEGFAVNGYVHCERIGRTASTKEFSKLTPEWVWEDDEMIEEGALDYGVA
jgi:predicted acyltransferase (DUF342 family)